MGRAPGKPASPGKKRKGAAGAEPRARKKAATDARPPVPAPPAKPRKLAAGSTAEPVGPVPLSTQRSGPQPRKIRARIRVVAPVVPALSPIARSVDPPRASPRDDREPDAAGRVMELHWGDEPRPSQTSNLVQRWVKRGDALLRRLAEHGVARHEYRADLKEGRFVWLAPDGRVSAEAQAKVICSWARSTSVVAMAWSDPLVRSSGIARVDGMSPELDDVDEEGAWRVAMKGADATRAEYLYRVTTPHAWYFLALNDLTFSPERQSFTPGTPVGLVLRTLTESRQGIESRAEPTDTVRERLSGVGNALLHEAEYAYRGTDWVARLERTGRLLLGLADRLPRGSYSTVAAGRPIDEWLTRDATIELSEAIALLEDEWAHFA